MVERQFARREAFAAILAGVFVASEDVSPVEPHLSSGQTVVDEQSYNSWYGYVEIHRGDPVVRIGLEIPPELADLAPTLEVVVRICSLFNRDDLGDLSAEK